MVFLAMNPFHARVVPRGAGLIGSNLVIQALGGIQSQIEWPEGKLVRVPQGPVLAVAADLLRSSSTLTKHAAVEITGENGQMLRIPEGFEHALLALSGVAGFTSKVTDFDSAPEERTIAWNDLDLSIPRPIRNSEIFVPEKNSRSLRIADAEVFA